MKMSTDRILATHVGSLPRPPELEEMIADKEKGRLDSARSASLPASISSAVADIVNKQAAIGISVVDDGEMSKYAYSTYARERMTGLTGIDQPLVLSELADFPNFAKRISLDIKTPACVGPLEYQGEAAVATDIANLKKALEAVSVEEAFMNASSPGIMAHYMPNKHYPSQEAYLHALGDAMKHEYDAIAASGLLLQIDCPDLALGRHFREKPMDVPDFRKEIALHVEMLKSCRARHSRRPDAIASVLGQLRVAPSPRHRSSRDLRYHHQGAPDGASGRGGQSAHSHEWSLFKETRLPEDKVIVPGVIDTCTNYIEHPEVVAQRIEQYANLVGRERVIAGTDCGFASFATFHTVDPDIAWRKLESLVQGADIASRRLWSTNAKPSAHASAS